MSIPLSKDLADEPADPYLWLEEIHSDAALAWAAERSEETESTFASAQRTALEARLRGILDDPDRLVVPSRHGDWMYDLWRDMANPRGLWRRTARAAFASGAPDWQVLLDIDALGRAEDTAWSFSRALHGPVGTPRVLLQLSPDGGDATVLREFDLDAMAFVVPGADPADSPFTLALHKSHVAWIDRDILLVASALDGGGVTDSGYPLSARVWHRGTPLAEASVVVEGAPSDVGVFVSVDHTGDRATAHVEVAHDFFHSEGWAWDTATIDGFASATPTRINAPEDARVAVHGELVAIRTTTPWQVAGQTHAGGTLLVGPLMTVTGNGNGEDLRVVFAPTPTAVLETWTWTRSRLVITVLDQVQSSIRSLDPLEDWRAHPLDLGMGDDDLFSASVVTLDADNDDELWVVVRGFVTPPTLIVTDAATPAPRIVARARAAFDTAGLTATQHWATSADGTQVPYFEVGPRDRVGTLPVLMNGYGGFEHSLTPEYSALVGAAWLEAGRVYVVANIRGGGEFGPAWHLAALREHRHRAYEDFAAVSRDLVRRGVSTSEQIGCHGRSNGGLLVGNMLTSFPDDFGAIVCGVPLLDMRRYTRLSAGASWIAEYGDPDDPADWAFIQTFSPYHLIDANRPYPPSLIYAATSDDRVGPVQARKMAARLMADTEAEVRYLEPTDGGHAGTIDNAATAALHATIYAFLGRTLSRPARTRSAR